MNTFQNGNGFHKGYARAAAIRHASVKKVKVALFLPGAQQHCLKVALESGAIDKYTFIIAVEAHKGTATKVSSFLRANFVSYYLHRGAVETLWLTGLRQKYNLPLLSYAFADFCGQMTTPLALWIRKELCRNICLGGKIAFTFSSKIRRSRLMTFLKEEYHEWEDQRLNEMAHWCNFRLTQQGPYGCDPNELLTLTALAAFLPFQRIGGRTSIDAVQAYKDTSPMMLVLVTLRCHFGDRTSYLENRQSTLLSRTWPCAASDYKFYQDEWVKLPSPAQKAWITRRRLCAS
jgi:hypothetical protein